MVRELSKTARKHRGNSSTPNTIPDLGKLADEYGPDLGYLTCDTTNPNSWQSFVDNILDRTATDIQFVQEL